MTKKKLILDFDGVIVNTIEAIARMYNYHYEGEEGFVPARWWEVNSWNFTDECPLMDEPTLCGFFDSKELFEYLEFMNWADEFIWKLADFYDISVCSTGTPENLQMKKTWIKKYIPCVKEFVGVNLNDYSDKAHVDMSGCIFVDDNESNLFTSNASEKICFGDLYTWNENWTGRRVFNWADLYVYLT